MLLSMMGSCIAFLLSQATKLFRIMRLKYLQPLLLLCLNFRHQRWQTSSLQQEVWKALRRRAVTFSIVLPLEKRHKWPAPEHKLQRSDLNFRSASITLLLTTLRCFDLNMQPKWRLKTFHEQPKKTCWAQEEGQSHLIGLAVVDECHVVLTAIAVKELLQICYKIWKLFALLTCSYGSLNLASRVPTLHNNVSFGTAVLHLVPKYMLGVLFQLLKMAASLQFLCRII